MTTPQTTARRILIVDDSVEYLNFMQMLLGAEGFDAEVAASPADLSERLQDRRPDLVISDVRIPGHAAFAVLDLLAADERTRDIPVLICTGAVQEVEAATARLRGERIDVLFKPFDIEELLTRVARLCPADGRTAQG
jgi:twitching motility two-component system response regulator PilH